MHLHTFRFDVNKKVVSFSWGHENDITNVAQNAPRNDSQSDSQNDTLNDTQNEKNISRTEKVLQVVSVNSMISKDALATMFGVTKLTILRDLQKLGFVWEGASKNGRWVKKDRK